MILVVDFGSQTAHLIGRRLRQLGIQVQYTNPEELVSNFDIRASDLQGIILSGGPSSVYDKGAPTISKDIFSLGIPVLGICYGWQLMARLLGGEVKSGSKEYGPEKLEVGIRNYELGILQNLPKEFTVFMSHGDSVTKLPAGFETLAKTRSVQHAAVANEKAKLYGVQFHPEAHHTENGLEILKNFASLCGETLHPLALNPKQIIQEIKEKVGGDKVIFAVSGGVDSSVAAFLVGQAIGRHLIPVYVDSGLMREGTDQLVTHIFTKLIHADLVIVDAKK